MMTSTDQTEQGPATRGPRGRFAPGASGNPGGRPKGSGVVGALRSAIREAAPQIVERMLAGAMAGDMGAARALLGLAIPPLKPTEEPAPVALHGETLTAKAESVLDAVARGEIAPSQGAALVASLGELAKLRELDLIEARLAALEAANAAR